MFFKSKKPYLEERAEIYFKNVRRVVSSCHVTEEIKIVTDEIITILATKMILRGDIIDLINQLTGLDSLFATYFMFECYRRLGSDSGTPKKKQKGFKEKASMYLKQALQGLEKLSQHPLKWVVDHYKHHIVDDDRSEYIAIVGLLNVVELNAAYAAH